MAPTPLGYSFTTFSSTIMEILLSVLLQQRHTAAGDFLIIQSLHILHVLHYHQRNLECDGVLKHADIKTCGLLKFVQPVYQRISVNIELSGGF